MENEKTDAFRNELKNDLFKWIDDELKEMRAETRGTDAWHSERLDVIGLCLIKGSEGLIYGMQQLKDAELDPPILQKIVDAWNEKNAKKDRQPMTFDTFVEARKGLKELRFYSNNNKHA